MSSIYNLEPQPTGSAILHTTLGEIHVELFAKQTPLTCRNFLQHCLDGYYDGTIFHRLVPNFIVQGGDPTGTGNGGESIYDGGAFGGDLDPWPMDQRHGQNAGSNGINFKDEFHSRLKINRRGILAMANEGKPDTNGSQFFFTLDKAEELNGKNTMFGRVAGDTIYNLAKIGESEVDETTERPLYPVKIERVEILVNPFSDMTKRSRVAQIQEKPKVEKEKKKKRKGGKQLLSFGDEEGDEDVPVFKKAKFDSRIVMAEEEEPPAPREKSSKSRHSQPKAADKQTSEIRAAHDKLDGPAAGNKGDEEMEEERPRHIHLPKRHKEPSHEPSPEPEPPKEKSALERANEELAALKASMRRTIHSEQPVKERKKSALETMIPETSIRGRKRRPGGNNTTVSEEQTSLRLLKAFQAKLDKAPPSKEIAAETPVSNEGDEAEKPLPDEEAELCDLHFIANCQSCTSWDKQEKEDSDDEGWMSHALSFAADKLGKDLSNRKKAEEELVVIDPREKARTLKEEKRAEREARAGGSGRAWDQAKNAQMARAASYRDDILRPLTEAHLRKYFVIVKSSIFSTTHDILPSSWAAISASLTNEPPAASLRTPYIAVHPRPEQGLAAAEQNFPSFDCGRRRAQLNPPNERRAGKIQRARITALSAGSQRRDKGTVKEKPRVPHLHHFHIRPAHCCG